MAVKSDIFIRKRHSMCIGMATWKRNDVLTLCLCRVEGFVDKNRDSQQDVFFDFLEKSKKTFIQEICEFKDLLTKVAQLGTNINKSDGSLSKGSVKKMMTNKGKPTVSDAFRLQLQVLVDVLESTNPW